MYYYGFKLYMSLRKESASGLEKVVGRLVTNQMLKGCEVYMHIRFD